MTFTPENKPSLGRFLAFWFGSFATIGLLLFFYGGVGWIPILIGGALALLISLYRRQRVRG